MHTLQTLQLLGLDPASESARRAIGLSPRTGAGSTPGSATSTGRSSRIMQDDRDRAYFGEDVGVIVQRVSAQPADGGWNCEVENGSVRSSFEHDDQRARRPARVRAWDRRVRGGAQGPPQR